MVGEVCSEMEKSKERHAKLYGGLRYIKREMEMVMALMKDKADKERLGVVQEMRIQQLQELAYDVEDFVERLWDPAAYGRLLLVATGLDPRLEQLRSINQFKETLSSIAADLKQTTESNSKREDKDQQADAAMSSDHDEEEGADDEEGLEAMDGPKSKIVELLEPSPGEGQQLRVISIVGCRGVGKTALARAVYHKYSSSSDHEFDCVAWVTAASGCNNKKALLDKILHKVRADLASRAPTEAQRASTTKPNLQDILSDKRFFYLYIYLSIPVLICRDL